MATDKKWKEFVMLGILSVITIYSVINFNERVGIIYGLTVLSSLIMYYALYDKFPSKVIPVEISENGRLINVAIAIGAYVVFILVAGVVAASLNHTTTSYVDNVNSLVGETFSATPVLYGSSVLKVGVWGIVIPRVETTYFFIIFPVLVLSLFNWFPTKIFTLSAVFVIGVFAWLFTAFHAEAKGITNNSALITTFIFGIVSLIVVIWQREQMSAILLHVITNTIATMKQLTIGFYSSGTFAFSITGALILIALIYATWFLIYFEIPFEKQIRSLVKG